MWKATTFRPISKLSSSWNVRISRRLLSSNQVPNKYEFPLRDEMPVITRSKAGDNEAVGIHDDDNRSDIGHDTESTNGNGQQQQQQKIVVKELDEKHKILNKAPVYIESVMEQYRNEIASHINDPPKTIISMLDNGFTVASQDLPYAQVATVGVLANVGSRHETDETTGVNHMLELLAFQSNSNYSTEEISERMDALGGVTFASSGREQMLYCIDILQSDIDEACDIIAGTVLRPNFTDEEVEGCKQIIPYMYEDIKPEPSMLDAKVLEGLQNCAYKNQPLGRPRLCPLEALPNLSAGKIREFRETHFTPNKMVLAGAGIEHQRLVELAQKHFSAMSPVNSNTNIPGSEKSIYTGGQYREKLQTKEGFTGVAVAFELGGWDDIEGDLVPACVLQMLLGGGSSFSPGGPGKGMYSRLYREILNRYYWAEAAEAFVLFHSESGLIGIKGSSSPDRSYDLVRVFCEHLAKVALYPVSDEELSRAKNMLKNNVLTQLESRLVLFEDIGRQVLTYGKRETLEETCKRIDRVSKDDILRTARKALSSAPSISSIGDDIDKVPSFDEIKGWFSG